MRRQSSWPRTTSVNPVGHFFILTAATAAESDHAPTHASTLTFQQTLLAKSKVNMFRPGQRRSDKRPRGRTELTSDASPLYKSRPEWACKAFVFVRVTVKGEDIAEHAQRILCTRPNADVVNICLQIAAISSSKKGWYGEWRNQC